MMYKIAITDDKVKFFNDEILSRIFTNPVEIIKTPNNKEDTKYLLKVDGITSVYEKEYLSYLCKKWAYCNSYIINEDFNKVFISKQEDVRYLLAEISSSETVNPFDIDRVFEATEWIYAQEINNTCTYATEIEMDRFFGLEKNK